MNHTHVTLEREIVELLDHQRAIYREASELLGPAGGAGAPDDGYEALLSPLNALMERAAANEQALRIRWQAWENGRFASTDVLKTSWEAAERELRRLIERVEGVTQRAQSARDAMVPLLSSGHTHVQMRAAYTNRD